MAKLEREYNVPLRREWLKVPKYKRAKKAVSALRAFLAKHMKSENVKLGVHVNRAIWSKGIKNPPHHVKVTAVKDDAGAVTAELTGIKLEAPKKAETQEEKKTPAKEEPKTESKVKKQAPKEKAEEKKAEKGEAESEAKKEAPKTAEKETVKDEPSAKQDTKNASQEKKEQPKEKAEKETKKDSAPNEASK